MTVSAFIDGLEAGTREAERAETACREDFARRIEVLAEHRAMTYRRLNLMRAIAEAVGRAEDAPMAAAYGLAHLRARLGWQEESDDRTEILDRFGPICRALHEGEREGDADGPDPAVALDMFERWYRERKGVSFWALFENRMPETPRVDY